MAFQIVVSDALNRRINLFSPGKLYAFQLAVADIAKGRGQGEKVHTSAVGQRDYYVYKRYDFNLYYSVDPRQPGSVVFEEFLSPDEEDLIMDTFAEEGR